MIALEVSGSNSEPRRWLTHPSITEFPRAEYLISRLNPIGSHYQCSLIISLHPYLHLSSLRHPMHLARQWYVLLLTEAILHLKSLRHPIDVITVRKPTNELLSRKRDPKIMPLVNQRPRRVPFHQADSLSMVGR